MGVREMKPGNEDRCCSCRAEVSTRGGSVMMSTVCGHYWCTACYKTQFIKESRRPCPNCQQPTKKSQIIIKEDDSLVEREKDIRNDLIQTFNKKREQFSSEKEYNDFLEDFEEMVFDLLHNRNKQSITAKKLAYRTENASLIAENSKRDKEDTIQMEQKIKKQKLDRVQLLEELKDLERKQLEVENEVKSLNALDPDNTSSHLRKRRDKARRNEQELASKRAKIEQETQAQRQNTPYPRLALPLPELIGRSNNNATPESDRRAGGENNVYIRD